MRTIAKRYLKWALVALSFMLYGVTILSAYGGYMNPERWTLPAMSVLVFPYLAIVTLIISIAWIVIKRYVPGCIGIAVLLACGPTFMEAVPFSLHGTGQKGERTFKMITYNCVHFWDLRNPEAKTSRSLSYIINSDADFVCLQEVYRLNGSELRQTTQAQLDSLLAKYPYHTEDRKRDVKFFSKYPFEVIHKDLKKGDNYRGFEICRLKIDGHPLTVINVHMPSFALTDSERNVLTDMSDYKTAKKSIEKMEGSLYRKLKKAFQWHAKVSGALADVTKELEEPIILCGDFNDVPGSWSYRQFIKAGFKDAYSETGFGHLITYNMHLMYFHIDQILYKGDLMPVYVKKNKLNASDHYPLEAEFSFFK